MFGEITDLHIKLSLARKIATIICVDLTILLLFHHSYYTVPLPPELSVQAQEVPRGLPVRLTIPTIEVEAKVESVGVTEEGVMATPSDSSVVGWFSLGPRPGDQGSAVIAGHLNTAEDDKGIFLHLSELRPGDQIFVENDEGKTVTFVVREIHSYNPGYADDVFGRGAGAHLNLVTCDGKWDPIQKNFSKRLVVFTDLVN